MQFLGGLVATIFLDIIYISIFYSSVAVGDTGRFSAGMAIFSLLLKPFSCCLVYHMHRERGGELPLRPGKSHSTRLPPAQPPVWCDFFLLSGRLGGPPSAQSTSGGVELLSSLWHQGASAAGLQMAVGTTPSVCFHPALPLEVCAPAMWGVPLSEQAGQGALCTSLLASGSAHAVLFGGGPSHFPALSDPVLLWELGVVSRWPGDPMREY